MIKEGDVLVVRGTQLEKFGWMILLLSLLTASSSEISFPSYNVVLGFWATFCSFTKNGRATFG